MHARPLPSARLARPVGPVCPSPSPRPRTACPAKGGRGRTAGERPTMSSPPSPFASAAPTKLVTVAPDGSDAWRLDPVIQALREGGVRV